MYQSKFLQEMPTVMLEYLVVLKHYPILPRRNAPAATKCLMRSRSAAVVVLSTTATGTANETTGRYIVISVKRRNNC